MRTVREAPAMVPLDAAVASGCPARATQLHFTCRIRSDDMNISATQEREDTAVSTWSGRRLVQHVPCRPEISGLEPFREPGIGFGELLKRILRAPPGPKPRQRHLGSQPPG